jgi:hypothetical protein
LPLVKTKTLLLLEAVAATPGGMTYTEMQEFVVRMNGLDWEEKSTRRKFHRFPGKGIVECSGRRYRGYWADRIPKIAKKFLEKGQDGRYTLACILGDENTILLRNGTYIRLRQGKLNRAPKHKKQAHDD